MSSRCLHILIARFPRPERSRSPLNSACAFDLSILVPHLLMRNRELSLSLSPLSHERNFRRTIGSESMREKMNIFRKSGKINNTKRNSVGDPFKRYMHFFYTFNQLASSRVATTCAHQPYVQWKCRWLSKFSTTWNLTHVIHSRVCLGEPYSHNSFDIRARYKCAWSATQLILFEPESSRTNRNCRSLWCFHVESDIELIPCKT